MKSENLICVCVCANDDFLGFILSEIHFNFSALFQQMVLLLFSHLYAQPQTFLHFFLLFCFVFGLAMSVFSHIKKIDKKGKCQRWIAPVLNCHGQPRGHWESGFSFHGVSQWISQRHSTTAMTFLGPASGMMAFGLSPTLILFFPACISFLDEKFLFW